MQQTYDSKLIVSYRLNGLANQLSAVGLADNIPIFNYSTIELIEELPLYRLREYPFLQQARLMADSGDYEFFMIGIPSNNEDATIVWKDTFRTQISLPEGSFLIGIMGCATT